MKQENKIRIWFYTLLLGFAIAALISIPFKNALMPYVPHTFRFDNRKNEFKIKRLAVVGDFSDWQERFYLYDRDGDGIWQTTLPLKPGWHSYRFLVNGKHWIRDWSVGDYGGAYSNSLIYVDTMAIPKLQYMNPSSGSWLYQKTDRLRFYFSKGIESWLKKKSVRMTLDSIQVKFYQNDSLLTVPLKQLSDGEHDWTVELRKRDGTLVYRKSGIFFVNYQNQKPQAIAGNTQIVFANEPIMLNGSLSFDPDFEPLTSFYWRQIRGPERVVLSNANEPFARLKAPAPGRYWFKLTVKDSCGAQGSDTTEIIVLNEAQPLQTFSAEFSSLNVPVRKAALVGEFNQWDAKKNPMQFDSLSGKWTVQLPLQSGKWEYKFVVNDSLWIPDPNNTQKVADGWNGFNSIKTVPHDSLFDGQFIETGTGKNWLTIGFKLQKNKGQKFKWFADIQNPTKKCIVKDGALHFNVRWPQGNYFYYLVLKKGRRISKPKILLIRHFRNTGWQNFQSAPSWADTAIVYELFLRRYTRPGTFKSLMEKLPELKKFGINTLWMLPVYDGPTEHGYAPTSLFETNKDYGTLTDYRKLIKRAHQLGMKIIFDFVANHLSDQHRFVRAAYVNTQSPLRKWFYWKPDGTWGYHNDWDTLVNLNYHNPWVRHVMLNAALFWLSAGVDGFRCDVAWAVPHSFWKDFRRQIKMLNPDCLLLDEVLPRQPAFHDDEFDMSYDTDFYGNILDVLRGRKPISAIPLGIEKSQLNYPQGAQSLRYLENHDLPRFIGLFGEQLARVMAVVLFTVPGTPLVYYGQEYGAREIRPNFYSLKSSKWFDFYQKLIKFRKSSEVLKFGRLINVRIDDQNKIWWYRRKYGEKSVDVIINLSGKSKTINNVPKGTIIQLKGTNFKRIGKQTIKLANKSFIIIQEDGDQ